MAREENIAAQERFAEGVNSGNFDVFDEVVAPDVVDHDPAPEQGPGPEGFKEMFQTMRKITARAVQIGRFENGRLAERWGSSDQLAILQQLGAEPQPEEQEERQQKGLLDRAKEGLTGQ
jgi:hypothetical protein